MQQFEYRRLAMQLEIQHGINTAYVLLQSPTGIAYTAEQYFPLYCFPFLRSPSAKTENREDRVPC
jgi:hypothetical protein